MPLEMQVRVYGDRVGALARDAHGGIRFRPDPRWLEGGQRPPLGLSFLADPTPRVARGRLPTWFENLLPEEGSALRTWICKQRGLRESDAVGLLRVVGRDLPGAVEVLGEVAGDQDRAPREAPGARLRFSLAGMQLKLSMLLDGDRFSLPARGETGRWIVKIPGERFPELPEVEWATMTWAQATGFEMPGFHLLPIEEIQGVDPALLGTPRRAFAIKRFDRTNGDRIHQEDLAQALEIPPRDKYGDGDRPVSYDSLTRLVRDACGERAQGELLDRLAFVIASGNGDAHIKNWSFQWGRHDHRPWLSPCYDLVATVSWPASDGWQLRGGPRLALSLGKTRRFADLSRDRLDRFSERAHVANGTDRIIAGLERARASWAAIEAQAPERMRIAIAEHWRRTPILAAIS